MVGCTLFLYTLVIFTSFWLCESIHQTSDVNRWFKRVFYTKANVALDPSLQFGTLEFQFRGQGFVIHFIEDTSVKDIASVTVVNGKIPINFTEHILLYRGVACETGNAFTSAIIKLLDDGIDAIIHTNKGQIFLEPACRYKQYRMNNTSFCDTKQTSLHRTYSSIVYTPTDAKNLKNLKSKLAVFGGGTMHSEPRTELKVKTRRKRSLAGNICNLNLVADYHFYTQKGGSNLLHTIAEMSYLVKEADMLFRGTDFNGDGAGDNIGFHISNITIYNQPNTYRMYSISDVGDYLDAFSKYNFDSYCLSVAFTSKEFADGVIGLAWVASSNIYGSFGGICQKHIPYRSELLNLNTCLVTSKTSGEHMPMYQMSLVLAHEFGHNFGSPHDDSSSSICAPDNQYGNYLMYPYATEGTQPNNIEFSTCSINYMYPVLLNKGSCFKNQPDILPVCGNSFREGPEMCDCGTSQTCSRIDHCCTPSDIPDSDPDAPCTFRSTSGSQCSPKVSSCCTSSCQITTTVAKKVCRQATDCTNAAVCSGVSADCPELSLKTNGTKCYHGTRTCQNGKCIGSICLADGREPCTEGPDCECQVCCKTNVSSCSLWRNDDLQPLYRTVGTLCLDQKGYCNRDGVCLMQSPSGALDRFSQVFSQSDIDDAKEWFRKYWYYLVAAVGFLGILVLTFMKTCRGEEHIHTHAFMYGQLCKIQREADMQRHYLEKRRDETKERLEADIEKVDSETRHMELTKAVARMIVFFPTVPRSVLIQTLKSSAGEAVAVKSLLIRGYPFRRICDEPIA